MKCEDRVCEFFDYIISGVVEEFMVVVEKFFVFMVDIGLVVSYVELV